MTTLNDLMRGTLIVLLFALLAATRLGSLASNHAIPNVVDYADHVSLIVQAKAALVEGQFPVRTVLRDPQKWQYPIFQFYSPMAYTFAGTIYRFITPNNPWIAFKLSIWLALTLGAVYFYRVVYAFIPLRPVALLSSAAYLLAPYFILIINRWGAFPETLAMGILPAVLYYSVRCLENPQALRPFVLCALTWFLLLTVHIITFVYTSLFIGLFILCLAWRHPYSFRHLLGVGTAYAYAYLLGLWFVVPIQLLSHLLLVQTSIQNPGSFNTVTSMISLLSGSHISPELLSSVFIPYNSPVTPAIGWPALLAVGTAVYLWTINFRTHSKTFRERLLLPLLLLFFLAFFMVWSPINFWAWLPTPLKVAQFCFRLLTQVVWISSLLFAWAIAWLWKDNLDARHVVIGLLLLGMASSSWFPPQNRAPKLVADLIQQPLLTMSNSSYLISPAELVKKIPVYVDSLPLFSFFQKEVWHLDQTHEFSTLLLMNSKKAKLNVEGLLPEKVPEGAAVITKINDKIIAKHLLKPGKFKWSIPIGESVLSTHKNLFRLGFEIQRMKDQPVPVEKITISDLEPDFNFVRVDRVQPHCQYQHSVTHCRVTTTPKDGWVELPIPYYPHMTSILLNGEVTNVHAITRDGYILPGIKIPPNHPAEVTLQFTGMSWANRVSAFAWLVWGGLACAALFLNRKKS